MQNPLYETGKETATATTPESAESSINAEVSTVNNGPLNPGGDGRIEKKTIFIAVVLVTMSLLNFTDRYTVSSVLIDVEAYYSISKSTAGLMQTIFLAGFTICSPFVGYLGDRFNRKYLLIASMVIWLISILGGSFVTKSHFIVFLLSRALFGAATSFLTTIGVPIIGDAFASCPHLRSRTLTLYSIGPPLGNGLAYLISLIARDIYPDDWRMAMRFTPFLLAAILVLHTLTYRDPVRLSLKSEDSVEKRKFTTDMKILFSNHTYVLLLLCWTFGLTALSKLFHHAF